MTREEKNQVIEDLTQTLVENKNIYLADISGLDADATSRLRRLCFNRKVSLSVVKNTLLRKAMEKSGLDFEPMYDLLKGNTSIMISEAGNVPAKLIKEFRKKSEKPLLKGAFVEEAIYIGDDQLDALSDLKSKEELIGDIIMLLQSPIKNVVSGLQGTGGQKIAGLLKALEERAQ
ncbi:MAG: 50S ribosomal protein L10 [Flavobacteriales bacterium]|nr:50S ribosomal protein L10 [Flavobacteriales bacterium]